MENTSSRDAETEGWNQIALKMHRLVQEGRTKEIAHDFSKLQRGTGEALLRHIRSKIFNDQDAKAVMGEVYTDLFRALKKPEPVTHVTGFLRTVAENRIADFFRRRLQARSIPQDSRAGGREREETADPVFWEKQAGNAAGTDAVGAVDDRLFAEKMAPLILQRLRPELRDVLIKRHIEELSVAQTAEALGITYYMVTKRTQAAHREARAILDADMRIHP